MKSQAARHMISSLKSGFLNSVGIGGLVAGSLCISTAAYAQAQADASDQAQAGAVESVVVTGSHITTPGFEAPTPITSVSQQFLQSTNTIQPEDLEYLDPALIPNISFRSAQGEPGGTNFNLRGLGTTRTLLLLDGHRTMPTSYDGTTDVSILPLSLIKREDVVTGGASAAYGSDAVAGVVNIILDDQYEGFKGSAQVGESQYHDEQQSDLTATYGTSFASGKGHIVISGEVYTNGGGDGTYTRRPWAKEGYGGILPNPLYTAGVANGQPQYIAIRNAQDTNASLGGLITSGPLKGTMFGAGGSVQQLQYGTFVGSSFMQGGSYANGKSAGGNTTAFTPGGTGDQIWDANDIGPRQGRESLFAHGTYDISPNLTIWGQGMIVSQTGKTMVSSNVSFANLNMSIQNPYLPSQIVSQMTADGINSFTMGRLNTDLGFNYADTSNNYVAWSGGLNGKLGGTWTWDATAQYGANQFNYDLLHNRNNVKWAQDIDVIANPATGGVTGTPVGAPICRSNLANANPGCVPLDIFGTNTITPAQAATVTGTSWNQWAQESWDFTANVQGIAFKDWAGDVSVATGAEARRLSLHGTADANSIAGIWQTNNTLPFSGSEQVEEGYIETDVPLLANIPFARLVNFNGAFRYANYSFSGGAETWKLGLNWTVDDDLRFRATSSRDLRAPSINELYSTGGVGFNTFTDDLLNKQYSTNWSAVGNPHLVPEVGIDNTAGVVYSPSWFPGLQASVDYWSINLHKGIVSISQQQQIDDCYIYNLTSVCGGIVRSPTTGLITFLQGGTYNAQTIQLDGVDFEADYAIAGDEIWPGLPGNFLFHSSWAYSGNFTTTQPGNVPVNTIGMGSDPKWRGTTTLVYSTDTFSTTLTYRYTGAMRYSNLYVVAPQGGVPNSIDENDIASRFYINLNADWQVPGLPNWRVFGGVDNLFNTAPPLDVTSAFEPTANSSQVYDLIGRQFKVGLRFNYD